MPHTPVVHRFHRHPARASVAGTALVLALCTAACGGSSPAPSGGTATDAAPPGRVALSERAARDAGVEVTPVRAIERTDRVRASGTVVMNERRTARPGAIVQGLLVDMAVQPGDEVRAGATLARLHSHVVHDAWAGYFKAVAERRTSEREVAFARTAEARAERLLRDKALSAQEVERAAADRVHADATLAAARAEVTRAEEELEHYGITAREDADPTTASQIPVTSPFAGVVIERLASPGSAVTPGMPLLVISDLSTVWVQAEVDETHLPQLARGRNAEITVAAYPGERFTGAIDAVGDVINPATRRVTVRIAVPNPGRRLKPQMFASVALGTSAPRTVLVVPGRSIQQSEGETVVFVRGTDGAYHRRPVVTGAEIDGLVEIVKGLADGDQVVTAGAFLLKSAVAPPEPEA